VDIFVIGAPHASPCSVRRMISACISGERAVK
jgi:hypothetical protein